MTGPTKFPQPYVAKKKPGQRVRDHGARRRESEWRTYQAAWQKPIDAMPACSPELFYNLRRNVLVLNRKQCARLLRVHVSSVLFWETGKHPVPFHAYLALLLASESQHYRLASEAWRDWQFIERIDTDSRYQYKNRVRHITEIVNHTIGAHFTPSDLERFHELRTQAEALQGEALLLRQRVDELVAENTHIREMFRVDGVTSELHAMHDRLQGLLSKINTAEVVPLRKAAG